MVFRPFRGVLALAAMSVLGAVSACDDDSSSLRARGSNGGQAGGGVEGGLDGGGNPGTGGADASPDAAEDAALDVEIEATADAPFEAEAAVDAPVEAEAAADAPTGTEAGCTPPDAICGGQCLDVLTELLHCGACDTACSTQNVTNLACVGGACQGSCAATFNDCNGDRRTDGCEAALLTDRNHCGRCGNACALDEDCVSGSCVECTPQITTRASVPTPPSDLKRSCFAGPDNFTNADCPVVSCGALTEVAYSYVDNRFSLELVAFDPQATIQKRTTLPSPNRYGWRVTLDGTAQTATFAGQANRTSTVPWSVLRLP